MLPRRALLAGLGALGLIASADRVVAQMPLDALVRDWYQRVFNEDIPHPAIYNDSRAVDCRGDGHLTSTAYLRTSNTTADLLVLYLTATD